MKVWDWICFFQSVLMTIFKHSLCQLTLRQERRRMDILVGRNSRMRASSHRTSIFDLINKRVNTPCHELANEERSFKFTSAKLTRHRRSLGSAWAIEWRQDVKLLKHVVRSIAQHAGRWLKLTWSEVRFWEDMDVGLIWRSNKYLSFIRSETKRITLP